MKTALICPLDWGIGHATRCVPVIRMFLKQGYRVVIGADGRPLEFLKQEFPDLTWFVFPGKKIRYSRNAGFIRSMILLAPGFLWQIMREHRRMNTFLKSEAVDVVVSDNRYGLWSRRCRTVLITHQLSIDLPGKLKWIRPLLERIVRSLAHRFDACWIPDFEQPLGLAGRLSHPKKLPRNAAYIGTLSRFSGKAAHSTAAHRTGTEILVLLSGPEPQRTILEENLLRQFLRTDLRTVFVRGVTEKAETSSPAPNLRLVSHMRTEELQELLGEVLVVISRSGYSTIMDLVSMGKRAIFIPTPGQTEQEYLARHLLEKKIYFSMDQDRFDLIYALELSRNFPGMVLENDYAALERAVAAL